MYLFGRNERTGLKVNRDDLLALVPEILFKNDKALAFSEDTLYRIIINPSSDLINSGAINFGHQSTPSIFIKDKNWGEIKFKSLPEKELIMSFKSGKTYLIVKEETWKIIKECNFLGA